MSKDEVRQLKAKIYKQVDELDDETALQMLEEAVSAFVSPSKADILDELNEDQQRRLQESIQQADEGKLLTNEEVKQKSKEWLSR